ncbi:hypothetical protein [Evansella tamaricis]|uniref:Uncharacterized protein n=1 Tax=Evansella tamaricis TaxID=2069301 RepID=A0ABS6JM86_9BACI|nr:hypothetical protein [Evansella tamaricis]MBU9713962.1 hypothetical protein [Evansella tamaricis]
MEEIPISPSNKQKKGSRFSGYAKNVIIILLFIALLKCFYMYYGERTINEENYKEQEKWLLHQMEETLNFTIRRVEDILDGNDEVSLERRVLSMLHQLEKLDDLFVYGNEVFDQDLNYPNAFYSMGRLFWGIADKETPDGKEILIRPFLEDGKISYDERIYLLILKGYLDHLNEGIHSNRPYNITVENLNEITEPLINQGIAQIYMKHKHVKERLDDD